MIRPYLTVLKDAFDEAFASRVLWLLLAASTVFLLALAPLALREERASRLQTSSVRDWPALIARIQREGEGRSATPGKRIWTLADEESRRAIAEAAEAGSPDRLRRAVPRTLEMLNNLLARPDLYEPTAWKGVRLDRETQDLLAAGAGRLSSGEIEFLNGRLIRAAFPDLLNRDSEKQIRLTYLGSTLGRPMPLTLALVTPIINRLLAQTMQFLVGTVAVFVAILVTAPMIPHTFEAGAIDLLLSKPVARPLLFLVKFFGGCAFILLNASYLVVGLWLVMGLRFGMWNAALLWCIPLFLFLFAIYYSVSALAAVLWRNATVSIVVTILFWAICFTVDTGKGVIERLFINPARIVAIVPTENGFMALNRSNEMVQWRSGAWDVAVGPERQPPPFVDPPPLIGLVWRAAGSEFLWAQRPMGGRFRFFDSGPKLSRAVESGGVWKRSDGPSLPAGTGWLFPDPQGGIVAVAASGVYRVDLEASQDAEPPKLLGIELPLPQKTPNVPIGPEPPLALEEPFAAAMDSATGDLLIYRSPTLIRLVRQNDGTYRRGTESRLAIADGPAALAVAGKAAMVAASDGEMLRVDAQSLTVQSRSRPAGKSEPYQIDASRDGRHFAALFHNGKLLLFQSQGNLVRTLQDVSAVAFDARGRLLVADRATRITVYDAALQRIAERFAPRLDMSERVYYYLVVPFYTVFPKPGELGSVVNYVLTDRDTVVNGPLLDADLRQSRTTLDVAGPVWSSLAFVVAVLAATCWYVHRVDI